MTLSKKATGRALPLPAGLFVGLGVSVIITLIFAAVITQLILKETVGEEWIGYGAMLAIPVSAAAGAFVASMTVKRRWLLVSLFEGGMYLLFLLSMNSFFFGGQFQGVWITVILILLGSFAVGAISLKGQSRGYKYRKKYRPR